MRISKFIVNLQFVNGLKQGKYISYDSGKIESQCEFVNNLLHGKEIYYYESGPLYTIYEWVNGVKHGKEIMYHSNGVICNTYNVRHNQVIYDEPPQDLCIILPCQ